MAVFFGKLDQFFVVTVPAFIYLGRIALDWVALLFELPNKAQFVELFLAFRLKNTIVVVFSLSRYPLSKGLVIFVKGGDLAVSVSVQNII